MSTPLATKSQILNVTDMGRFAAGHRVMSFSDYVNLMDQVWKRKWFQHMKQELWEVDEIFDLVYPYSTFILLAGKVFICPLSWLNFLLTTGSFYSEALAQNLNFLLYHLLALDLISTPLPA